jgi:hypothetical protein
MKDMVERRYTILRDERAKNKNHSNLHSEFSVILLENEICHDTIV